MQITFNNSTIGKQEFVENSITGITEDDWKKMSQIIEMALKTEILNQEQKKLVNSTNEVIKTKDSVKFKEFMKVNGANLVTGTLANIFSAGLLEVFLRFL